VSEVEISPIEQIIAEARAGRPYILVDGSDRENEGAMVIPAQFAGADIVNFMATHARGLICLAIDADRAHELDLTPMAARNQSGQGTVFTVSIEAREGVSTGISAADRARTIAVAVDPAMGKADLVSPGHVFPLVARDGGVLVRAGQVEASVDISRLAGLIPAGVICEIMNEDGTMSRLPELIAFAQAHGLKIGTIADLISYRRRTEFLLERVAEEPFSSHYGGDFRIIVYRNRIDGGEHVALVRGTIRANVPTLVRVHQLDFTADVLGWDAARRDYVPQSIRTLARHDGPAVAVFVRDPDLASISRRISGGRQAYSDNNSQRDYGIGAQMLKDLGVHEMILLTSSTRKLAGLEGFGLKIVDRKPVTEDQGARPLR
jgi:3,4-dihydroxy 2-butanone 4-phosphate synthase/GTP cyclohydrolase II